MKGKAKLRDVILLTVIICAILMCSGPGGASAASAPKKGGMIREGMHMDLASTDPHVGSSPFNGIVMNHIYETLVGLGDKLEFIPVLAERWDTSRDYKTYTFYLRKGKLFHNGREMVADDVKYSIERIMDPKTGSPRRSEFANTVDKIEVKDKYTIIIHLKQGNATLPYLLSLTWPVIAIVPREEVEKEGGVIKHPVGTGPYKFVEWKQGQYVLVERFDKYKPQPGPSNGFGGERIAYADSIKWVIIPEESSRMMALLNKEVDVIRDFPKSSFEKFQQDYAKRGLVMQRVSGLTIPCAFFNLNAPITNNLKFRQACAYAVDIDALSQAVGFGPVKSHSWVVAESQYWTPYHETWYKRDLNKVKQLLQEAGYKGEEVTYITHKQPMEFYRAAVIFQAQLAEAGINIKLDVMEQPALVKKFYDKSYQIAGWAVVQADPANNYAYYQFNGFEEQMPRMKQIREDATKTLDLNARRKLFEEAHKLQYEYVPAISYNVNPFYPTHWDYVKGFKATTTLERFWNVWLDK